MKLTTHDKVGELMIFRYRTTSTNFLCACARQNSLPFFKFGLTLLHGPIFAFNMVKNRPTIYLNVLKDINKTILK